MTLKLKVVCISARKRSSVQHNEPLEASVGQQDRPLGTTLRTQHHSLGTLPKVFAESTFL